MATYRSKLDGALMYMKRKLGKTLATTGTREVVRHQRQDLHNAVVNGFSIMQTTSTKQKRYNDAYANQA